MRRIQLIRSGEGSGGVVLQALETASASCWRFWALMRSLARKSSRGELAS